MSKIASMLRACLGAAALSAAFTPAFADPLVYIDPASTTVSMGGGNFTVGIFVSGLTAAAPTGGFSATLNWNPLLLSGFSYVADPTNGMGVSIDPSINDASLGFSAGGLDLYFIADQSYTDPTLFSEGAVFELAAVTFTPSAVHSGTTALTLSNVVLSSWDGKSTMTQDPASPRNGSVCVNDPASDNCGGGPVNVPEPTTLALVAAALAGAGWRRRARRGWAPA